MSGEAQSKLADIRSRRERNTTPRGEDVDYLLAEVVRLRERLDARLSAIHGLVYEHVPTGDGRREFVHQITRARADLEVTKA